MCEWRCEDADWAFWNIQARQLKWEEPPSFGRTLAWVAAPLPGLPGVRSASD